MPMPSKVSLTVGSLLAVSMIIAVASRLSCVADLFSSYAAPGETDEFMDDCDNLEARGTPSDLSDSDSYGGSSDDESSDEGRSEYKIVSEGRIPFDKDQTEAGTAPVNEREAGACTAWPSAADAFHGERLESVPRVAGVEESGDEDQEEALVKSLDDMEASPGSLPSDRPYDADDDADDDDDNVWDMLQSLAKELEDAQKNSSTLRLQLDEARADVCALQTRVAQHETRARFVSEDLDVAIEDNDTLHAQNRRLQARLQEASNEIATLREGLAAASHALKGRETELWGTRRALQGLREAHVELIEAATKRQSSKVGSLSLDERVRGR